MKLCTAAVTVLSLALLFTACEEGPSASVPPEPPEQGPPEPSPPATSLTWTAPQPLRTGLAGVHGDPGMAAAGSTLFLVFGERGLEDGSLTDVYVARRADGAWSAPLNLSRTQAQSQDPSIALDAAGAAHVVWGERTHNPLRPPQFGGPTDVFYSTNESGAWSAPVSLYRSPDESLIAPEQPVVAPDGTIHLAFSAKYPPRNYPTVLHARRAGGTWSAERPVTKGYDPDLAVDPQGRLWIVYIVPDSAGALETGYDKNSVFLVRSDDGGESWSAPRLLSRSGRLGAEDPRVVVDRDGRVHALWFKDLSGDLFPEEIWHTYSADAGETWSTPGTIAPGLRGQPRALRVIPDPNGGLHTTFHLTGPGSTFPPRPPYRAYYARWKDGAWSAPEHLFAADTVGQEIGIALDGSDSLHVVLGAADIGELRGFYHAAAKASGPGQ